MSSAALPIRGNRRTEIGVVTSDKTTKTRRVEIDRLVPHPKYGKFQRRRTVAIAQSPLSPKRLDLDPFTF